MEKLMEREGESHGKEGRADRNEKTEVGVKLQQYENITEVREEVREHRCDIC